MVLLFKNRELGAPASRTVHKSEREGEVPYTTAVPAVVQHDVRVHYGSWRTKKMSADSNTSFTDCIVVLTKGREAYRGTQKRARSAKPLSVQFSTVCTYVPDLGKPRQVCAFREVAGATHIANKDNKDLTSDFPRRKNAANR